MRVSKQESGIIIDGQMDIILSFRENQSVIHIENLDKGELKNFHLVEGWEKDFIFPILERKYNVNKVQRFFIKLIFMTLCLRKTEYVINKDGVTIFSTNADITYGN